MHITLLLHLCCKRAGSPIVKLEKVLIIFAANLEIHFYRNRDLLVYGGFGCVQIENKLSSSRYRLGLLR